MKRNILYLALFAAFGSYAQNCDDLKAENSSLKAQKIALDEENTYLKKVLKVNTPIKEEEKDGVNAKIIKVEGVLNEQTVYITFLFESKTVKKEFGASEGNLIDLEGNTFKIDFFKIKDNLYPKLIQGVPVKIKLAFVYKDVFENGAPKIIKLVNLPVSNSDNGLPHSTHFEFRDIPLTWK